MTTPDDNTAIDVRDFYFRIGGKEILRNVSFSVMRGEYVAIVGPNGAGKTTLLKCLDRILTGGTGRIEIFGRPLGRYRQKELARRVSYVPQADGHVSPFTVEQFVLMGRYPHLSPFSTVGRHDRQLVREVLKQTGTAEFADRPLGTLSGGERQKVFIAAALAQGADVLLLDEPTTVLDYHHEAEVRALLAAANKRSGVTIVNVTHDLNHAVLESDRVVALREGAVVFDGPPSNIMKTDVLRRIYETPLLLVDHPQATIPVIVPRIPLETTP